MGTQIDIMFDWIILSPEAIAGALLLLVLVAVVAERVSFTRTTLSCTGSQDTSSWCQANEIRFQTIEVVLLLVGLGLSFATKTIRAWEYRSFLMLAVSLALVWSLPDFSLANSRASPFIALVKGIAASMGMIVIFLWSSSWWNPTGLLDSAILGVAVHEVLTRFRLMQNGTRLTRVALLAIGVGLWALVTLL